LHEASITAGAAEYQFWTGTTQSGGFEDWSAAGLQQDGSWWLHWAGWMTRQTSERVPARQPDSGVSPAL
jgi:polyhydroxyalkanoate synthase